MPDFIKWGVTGYPADHYLLVLRNHGQGWDDTDIYANERGAGARLMRSKPIRHALKVRKYPSKRDELDADFIKNGPDSYLARFFSW